jgi:hypothetical protein
VPDANLAGGQRAIRGRGLPWWRYRLGDGRDGQQAEDEDGDEERSGEAAVSAQGTLPQRVVEPF